MRLKEKINIKGIEWKCYKKENGKDYLTTSDVLSEDIVKEIVDNQMNRYKNGMRYNTNVIDSSWKNSIPRKVLNDKFKEKYLSDIELTEEVRLLTKEEAENLDDELNEVSDWYWTMTAAEPSSNYAYVFYVFGSSYPGYLNAYYVDNTSPGVRPVICLKEKQNSNNKIVENRFEKIEKITMCTSGIMGFDGVINITTELKNKLNEVIDNLNYLLEKSDKE